METTKLLLPSTSIDPIERRVSDLRLAALGRRVTATPSIINLISELAWPPRDGMATAIRTAPIGAEVSAHG